MSAPTREGRSIEDLKQLLTESPVDVYVDKLMKSIERYKNSTLDSDIQRRQIRKNIDQLIANVRHLAQTT